MLACLTQAPTLAPAVPVFASQLGGDCLIVTERCGGAHAAGGTQLVLN